MAPLGSPVRTDDLLNTENSNELEGLIFAKQFIALLDEGETFFDFRALHDKQKHKTGVPVRGGLPAMWRELQRLNSLGYGIFLTVNATDGIGVEKKNISRVRAVWHEDDAKGEGRPEFPLAPSLVVQTSPGKFHRYWLCDDMSPEQFAGVMRCMVKVYGGDKNAADLARVLRLPGSLHVKGDPFPVAIIEASGKRYTGMELAAAFPAPPEEERAPARPAKPPMEFSSDRDADLMSALYAIPADERHLWVRVGMALKVEYGDQGREIWETWAKTSKEWDEHGARKWDSFNKGDVKGNSIFYIAEKEFGWKQPIREKQEDDASRSATAWAERHAGNVVPLRLGGRNAALPLEVKPKTASEFELIPASRLLGAGPKPQDWVVDGLVLGRDLTTLGGDGGTGKSLLALQLSLACATGGKWLGKQARQCKTVYLSAEDDADELQRRLHYMAPQFGPVPDDTLFFVDRAGEDAELVTFDKDSNLKETKLLIWLEVVIRDHGIGLAVLDNLADIFGDDNENGKRRVGKFMSRLRKIALAYNCAIFILYHPSVSGMNDGTGRSGSVQWNNKVRSRLYFTAQDEKGNEYLDGDGRMLRVMKANRGKKGDEIALIWDNHFFHVQVDLSSFIRGVGADLTKAKAVFMVMLENWARLGRGDLSSAYNSPRYAPKLFAAEGDECEGVNEESFKAAMEALLNGGDLEIIEEGKGTHARKKLARMWH